MKEVDQNIFEHHWIKIPPKKLKELKAVKDKIAEIESR